MHGISYIFDRDLGIVDRLLWLFLVIAFASVAAALTWNLWIQWRNERVMTNAKNEYIYIRDGRPAPPCGEGGFPAP